MTRCQHCHRPTSLYLCENCATTLANMLDQLVWLIDELDTRIQRLDRISIGTIGRNRRPDEMNIIDFDAAELARRVRKRLLHWVTTIAQHHTGRQPPALDTVTTQSLARWLATNTHAIALIDLNNKGRHQLYDDINQLVGTDHRAGQLVQAVDRQPERHFAGMCPTITGKHHDGTPRECGQTLFADIDDTTTECPDCHQLINVEKNRHQAARDRDLKPRTELVDILANVGEPVDERQVDRWISARRLRIRGYLHNGEMVRFRINEHSIALYSVARARKLRRRDHHLKHQNTPA